MSLSRHVSPLWPPLVREMIRERYERASLDAGASTAGTASEHNVPAPPFCRLTHRGEPFSAMLIDSASLPYSHASAILHYTPNSTPQVPGSGVFIICYIVEGRRKTVQQQHSLASRGYPPFPFSYPAVQSPLYDRCPGDISNSCHSTALQGEKQYV